MQLSAPERQVLVAMYAIISTIKDSPEGAPEGVLYMGVMNRMSHFQFSTLIGLLKDKGWITSKAHLLFWTGPDVLQ